MAAVVLAGVIGAAGCGGPQLPTATPILPDVPDSGSSSARPDLTVAPEGLLGADWSDPVRLPAPFGSGIGSLLAASDETTIVVVGSIFGLDETVSPTSWISVDGDSWTAVDVGAAFAGVQPADMIANHLGFLVVGSVGAPVQPEDDIDNLRGVVLVSDDGVEWNRSEDPVFEGAYVQSVALGSDGLMAVGVAPSIGENEKCPVGLVWTSPDGMTWARSETAAPWCGSPAGFIGNRDGFFAAGQPADADPSGPIAEAVTVVWSSANGSSWTEIGRLAETSPTAIAGMATGPEGIVLIGTQQEAAEQRQVAWSLQAQGMGERPEASMLPGDGRLDGRSSSLVAVPGGGFVASGVAPGTNSPRTAVWTSRDGVTWEEAERSHALDAAAPMRTMVLHGSSLIAIGGTGSGVAWISPKRAPPSAPEPELPLRFESTALPDGNGRPAGIAISHDGTWLVAATDSEAGTEPTTRVWRSSDGETWDIATPDGFRGADVEAIAWAGTQFVAVGGEFIPGVGHAPLAWTSPDGIAWTRARIGPTPSDPAFSEARFTGLSASDQGVVVAVATGGSLPPDECPASLDTGSVWRSTDGVSWQRITDAALACATTSAVATAGDGFVIVGSRDSVRLRTSGNAAAADEINRPAAWTSADGISWREATFPDGAPLVRLEAVATGSAGLVAAGHAPRPMSGPAFFRSDDGRTWEVATYDERVEPAEALVTGLGAADEGYVAVGYLSDIRRERGAAAAWTSLDGGTWVRVLGDAHGEFAAFPFGLVSPVWHEGRLLAIGIGAEHLSLWHGHPGER